MAQLTEFMLNHPLLVGATLMALIAAVGMELRLRGRAAVAVPAGEAVLLINKGATVVDLRAAADFDTRHIVDAVNLSAGELGEKPEARLKKKNRPVLLVCDSGAASSKLVGTLRKAGFEQAWSLAGGLPAWERENLPLVGNKAKS
jgi:rhodanese-related sulfurtransferase